MSHIDDLIAEHCPDGVEFVRLGDLLNYEQPGKYLVKSTAYDDSFNTPVLTAGQSFILGYTDETDGIYLASRKEAVIIFDDFTTAFKWVDFNFKAKSSAMKMLTPKHGVNFRYIWFAMQTISYAPQDHARQWIGTYSQFSIPVPPVEVQRAIVEILDNFSTLEGRRLQYQHYRDLLFDFHETSEVPYLALNTVGSFTRGRRFTKNDIVESGIPSIHYGEIYTSYGVAASEAARQVRSEMRPQLRFAQQDDVIFAGVGETVKDVGKAVAWLGKDSVAVHDDTFFFTSSLNPLYVAHFAQTTSFNSQKAAHVARGKVKRLSASGLGAIKIPVPSVYEQNRVVAILDKFDALVNDLSVGLPAELAARRQQYEYYRDKLLTFKELTPESV